MHKNNNNNKITPYFIKNGGYFLVNHEMVGITEDSDIIYVPETLVELTEQELIDFVVTLEMRDEEGNLLTEQQKIDLANAWLDNNFRNL